MTENRQIVVASLPQGALQATDYELRSGAERISVIGSATGATGLSVTAPAGVLMLTLRVEHVLVSGTRPTKTGGAHQ